MVYLGIFCGYLFGHYKTGLFFWVNSMHFSIFFTKMEIFIVWLLTFQKFVFGLSDIFFSGKQ